MLKKIINKNPILIGVMGIILLVVFLVIQSILYKVREIEPTYEMQETKREKNMTTKTPAEAVLYLWEAAQAEDTDRALRVFPISAITSKAKINNIIKKEQTFYGDIAPAPAKNYGIYYSLAMAEIELPYLKLYERFIEKFQQIESPDLKEIYYIPFNEKQEKEFLSLQDDIGAEEGCIMYATVESDGKEYGILLELVKYGKTWMIYDIEEDFEQVSSFELKSKIQVEDGDLEKKKEFEKITKKRRKIIESVEVFLGSNYTWWNSSYGKSPEELMETFIHYIQKSRVDVVMTLGNSNTEDIELEEVNVPAMEAKSGFAKKLKYFFYCMLLEEDVSEPLKLQELDMSVDKLVDALNPKYFFYMDMVKMISVSENVYEIYFLYETNYYKFDFEFIKFEQGWQIHDICNMEKYTAEEYRELDI